MTADVTLRDPWWLLVLAIIPAVFWLRRWRAATVLLVPFASAWCRPTPWRIVRWPWLAAIAGAALLTLALARPQRTIQRTIASEGYDIMLAVDLSGSMLTEDFRRDGRVINRLDAVKPIVANFIEHRPQDRIGIVVFSGRAYTLAPLTFDHVWLQRQVQRLRSGTIEDGTAIGDALGVALRRLESASGVRAGRREGAFVVLLTDGANNSGLFAPLEAAALAKERGIPVYTIATGSHGRVRIPIVNDKGQREFHEIRSEIDELTLWLMASRTGGVFFRAEWPEMIEGAFRAIDLARKIQFEARTLTIREELFPWLAVPGLALLATAALAFRPPWRRLALA